MGTRALYHELTPDFRPDAATPGRRDVLLAGAAGLGGVAALGATAFSGRALADPVARGGTTFSARHVADLARRAAKAPFHEVARHTPALPTLAYDEYRDIRFNPERAVWRRDGLAAQLQFFPLGHLTDRPVDIFIVDGDRARPAKIDPASFSIGAVARKKIKAVPGAAAGFRIHGPINRPDYFDEHTVFHGASYFRAVGRGQVYGLSARGLALDTAQPRGEEFPLFKSFWIETPVKGEMRVVVHALLDSPRVCGAYRFEILPGDDTVMNVSCELFPRRDLSHVGVAPLTSMFLHGPGCQRIGGDFRPAVHDSEGLLILNGRGEQLWRPLSNPKTLQVSAFMDRNPKGFGLVQRDRSFQAFEDLEALYEKRPTAWVEPGEGWGAGHVELVEIPTDKEIHDNIVCYWKPADALRAGGAYRFSYTLRFTGREPVTRSNVGRVFKTRAGFGEQRDTARFVVDFVGIDQSDKDAPLAAKLVSGSAEATSKVVLQNNPEIGGVRASFDVAMAGLATADLRLDLLRRGRPVSESWFYRWVRW